MMILWKNPYHLKAKKMKDRKITLSLETAKEWYNKGGELKEVALQAYSEGELKPKPLVRSWEDAFNGYGCWVGPDAKLEAYPNSGGGPNGNASVITSDSNKGMFRTKAHAKSALAFAQLSHIVADANGDWMPDWSLSCERKYSIDSTDSGLRADPCGGLFHHLPMKSKKIAEECLRLHPKLWADYWMI